MKKLQYLQLQMNSTYYFRYKLNDKLALEIVLNNGFLCITSSHNEAVEKTTNSSSTKPRHHFFNFQHYAQLFI